MKISKFLFNSVLGLTVCHSLSSAIGQEESHSHKEVEHIHKEGEECSHEEEEGCDGHDHEHEAEHVHKEDEVCDGHDHSGKEEEFLSAAPAGFQDFIPVKIDDNARRSLNMQTEKIIKRPYQGSKTFYGQMEIPPHAVTTYALPSSGRVDLHVRSAQHVNKGDLLYSLASPDILDLQAKAQEDANALTQNETELKALIARQKRLSEIGTKNVELDTSIVFKRAERPKLQAAAEISNGKLAMALSGGSLKDSHLEVRADKDGTVQSIGLTKGAWGEQGASVVVLTNKGELEFKAAVHASDPLNKATGILTVESPNAAESISLTGALRVSDQINPENQTRTIYFVPDEVPESSFAGQVARLEVSTGGSAQDGFIPVPNSAVVKVGVNDVVFLQDAANPNQFIMKKVVTLPSRQGMTPVKGVKEGQILVTRGGYELKYVLPADGGGQKKAAGHFHADGKFHEGEH